MNTYVTMVPLRHSVHSLKPRISDEPANNTTIRNDMKMICEYSARKNNANGMLAYSTLYPETNSDSPSVKSNGARFVSARQDTNIIKATGHKPKASQPVNDCADAMLCRLKDFVTMTTFMISKPIETS